MTTLDHNTTPIAESIIPSAEFRAAVDQLLIECRPDLPPTPWIDQAIFDHYGALTGEEFDRVRDTVLQYMTLIVAREEFGL